MEPKKNVQEIIAQNDRTFYFKLNSLFDGLTDICGCFACIFLAIPCFCLLPHINNNDNGYSVIINIIKCYEWFYLTCETDTNNYCKIATSKQKKTMELAHDSA